MDELEQQLDSLRRTVERGRLVEGLELYPGWKLVREELEKMLEALRQQAVSPKLLGNSYQHASVVGAHSALQSFLNILSGIKKAKGIAEEDAKEIEDVVRENRKLGIHSKI